MEQFTVYVDETIPMVITDDGVTQMAKTLPAKDFCDYLTKKGVAFSIKL